MILLCQKQCYTGYFNAKKLGKKPNIIVNCYDSRNSIPQQAVFFEGSGNGLLNMVKLEIMRMYMFKYLVERAGESYNI